MILISWWPKQKTWSVSVPWYAWLLVTSAIWKMALGPKWQQKTWCADLNSCADPPVVFEERRSARDCWQHDEVYPFDNVCFGIRQALTKMSWKLWGGTWQPQLTFMHANNVIVVGWHNHCYHCQTPSASNKISYDDLFCWHMPLVCSLTLQMLSTTKMASLGLSSLWYLQITYALWMRKFKFRNSED